MHVIGVAQGYSAVFGVNYVGHQVLVFELQRRLTVGRIVLLSSVMHRWAAHDAATLSDPPHPQPGLKGVQKTLIKYERADGVQLSGQLYTPTGYDSKADGPLPTILWAYPREYKSKKSAGQVRGSEHTFTMVGWGSPLFWLARGYAVV